jgi:hypothetical protein
MVIFCVARVSGEANRYSSSVIGSLRRTFGLTYGGSERTFVAVRVVEPE